MIINNFALIGKLLYQLAREDLVFDLIILQRKKDVPEHKSGKIIYRKLIRSKDSLLEREFLIKTLCEQYRMLYLVMLRCGVLGLYTMVVNYQKKQ